MWVLHAPISPYHSSFDNIIPKMSESGVFPYVAAEVAMQAQKEGWARLQLTKEEVYKRELFGVGTPHPLFDDMLGDYLAISKSEYSLISSSSIFSRQKREYS